METDRQSTAVQRCREARARAVLAAGAAACLLRDARALLAASAELRERPPGARRPDSRP